MSIDYKAIAELEFKNFQEKYHGDYDTKYAIYTMGIPASGKSSSVGYILKKLGIPKQSIILLDPDDIMSRIEGYSNTLSSSNKTKFNRASIIITSKILDNLIENNMSFVYFGTGRSYQSYSRNMRKTSKHDFINILVNVELELEEAIRRNSKRKRSLGRNIIANINSTLKHPIKEGKPDTRLDLYQKLCDIVFQVNTNINPPKINLVKKKDGLLSALNTTNSNNSINSNNSSSTRKRSIKSTENYSQRSNKSNKKKSFNKTVKRASNYNN